MNFINHLARVFLPIGVSICQWLEKKPTFSCNEIDNQRNEITNIILDERLLTVAKINFVKQYYAVFVYFYEHKIYIQLVSEG